MNRWLGKWKCTHKSTLDCFTHWENCTKTRYIHCLNFSLFRCMVSAWRHEGLELFQSIVQNSITFSLRVYVHSTRAFARFAISKRTNRTFALDCCAFQNERTKQTDSWNFLNSVFVFFFGVWCVFEVARVKRKRKRAFNQFENNDERATIFDRFCESYTGTHWATSVAMSVSSSTVAVETFVARIIWAIDLW